MVERTLIEIPNQSDWVIQITDDGSRTLLNPASGIAFHSASGALAETLHVYLENSGVGEKLRQGIEVQVIEVGLGDCVGDVGYHRSCVKQSSGSSLSCLRMQSVGLGSDQVVAI